MSDWKKEVTDSSLMQFTKEALVAIVLRLEASLGDVKVRYRELYDKQQELSYMELFDKHQELKAEIEKLKEEAEERKNHYLVLAQNVRDVGNLYKAENERLEQYNTDLKYENIDVKAENAKLAAKLHIATVALEFYAEKKNYYYNHKYNTTHNPIYNGCGSRARKAVSEMRSIDDDRRES
tara:strand:- start:130 stop:669 length:540 start_codon:yes stop_codon:yes gene_type:complete